MAEELAEALKQAGAQEVWVAGKPGLIHRRRPLHPHAQP
jgi:triphosphoribosyl-dephospho-CoA synthetase